MTDLDYLREAYKVAADLSTDPSTQNGAILVNASGEILIGDANHFPQGVKETPERWDRRAQRPLKYLFVEHAERNVIYAAARAGIKTEGLIMYVPWFACAECARAIIQAGIKEVVGHDWIVHKKRPDWADSIKVGDLMFAEAGVKVRRVLGKLECVSVRFDGTLRQP